MAIPLIAAGVAAAASWFLSGCGEEEGDPCEGVDCSGHGVCVPTSDAYVCVCERGYYQDGPECLSDTAEDDGAQAVDVEEVPDETADDDADAEIDLNQDLPYCDDQYCISSRSYRCDYREISEGKVLMKNRLIECSPEQACEYGKCVTHPDLSDPNCGGTRRAACQVTDEHDLVEEGYNDEVEGHDAAKSCSNPVMCNMYDECNTYSEYPQIYQCGEDAAFKLFGNYSDYSSQPMSNDHYAFSMRVDTLPMSTHYQVETKHDFYYQHICPSEENQSTAPADACADVLAPVMDIMFGDDQRAQIHQDEAWKRCQYQLMATFSSAGVADGKVRIQIRNGGVNCTRLDGTTDRTYLSVLAVAKARVWSCECIDK